MIITIHQPEHLPWLGFFNKLSKADLFVILDSVQFEKNYFQNRNRILGTNGVQWIGIPVTTKGHTDNDIAHTEISYEGGNKRWREKYLRTLEMSYGKHPFFRNVYPIIETAISLDTLFFYDINIAIIQELSSYMGFFPKFIKSSELGVSGLKSDLILDICKKTEATTYIAGPSGRDYLCKSDFEEANIRVAYNDFVHPSYTQLRQKEFVSHLSSVDLLMNYSADDARDIILSGLRGLNYD